jgi:hypothetical protein
MSGQGCKKQLIDSYAVQRLSPTNKTLSKDGRETQPTANDVSNGLEQAPFQQYSQEPSAEHTR